MHLIGKSKKAIMDNQSMVSVSLSRKSSFSSNASALAFSSPSPNHMRVDLNGSVVLSNPENFLQPVAPTHKRSITSENQLNIEPRAGDVEFQHVESSSDFLLGGQNRSGKF